MQDSYTGDIGDFGKYLLLNEIHRKSNGNIRLGINWFYVERKGNKTGDGKHIDYLCDENRNSKKYSLCYPELYNQLKSIVHNDRRNIKEIENGMVLPEETAFYSKPLPYSSVDRDNWFKESLAELKKADIIFIDPDNGIQTDKIKKTQKRAVKYVFKDEIRQYYELGKSLIIYNHKDRKPQSEYNRKIRDIGYYVEAWHDPMVLRFKRVSVRDFVFLTQKNHHGLIEEIITHLTRAPYDFLFTRYW